MDLKLNRVIKIENDSKCSRNKCRKLCLVLSFPANSLLLFFYFKTGRPGCYAEGKIKDY